MLGVWVKGCSAALHGEGPVEDILLSSRSRDGRAKGDTPLRMYGRAPSHKICLQNLKKVRGAFLMRCHVCHDLAQKIEHFVLIFKT